MPKKKNKRISVDNSLQEKQQLQTVSANKDEVIQKSCSKEDKKQEKVIKELVQTLSEEPSESCSKITIYQNTSKESKTAKKNKSTENKLVQEFQCPEKPSVEPVLVTQASSQSFGIKKYTYNVPRRQNDNNNSNKINHNNNYVEKKFCLEVNYFPINFKNTKIKIFHYDCAFNPDRPKALIKEAFILLKKKAFPHRYPAFDGRRNMFAANRKLFEDNESNTYSLDVFDPEREVDKEYTVTIKLVAELSLSTLFQYLKNGSTDNVPQDVIQVIDIALRHAPMYSVDLVNAGRSFFTKPRYPKDLTGGLELWHGFYQSLAAASNKTYLNIDIANKAFPIGQPVLRYLTKNLFIKDLNVRLDSKECSKLENFIKGLKIEYQFQNTNGKREKRVYKVISLESASDEYEFEDDNKVKMTVEKYFHVVKKQTLLYPKLPLLHVGTKGIRLPLELCSLYPSQTVMRKLDEKQTSEMVKNCAQSTTVRKKRIMDNATLAGFINNPVLKEFGIEVGTDFCKVEAIILKSPAIQYAKKGIAKVEKGSWSMARNTILKTNGLTQWLILNTDDRLRPEEINNMIKIFQEKGKVMGIVVNPPKRISVIRGPGFKINENQIQQELSRAKTNFAPLQLVLVIMNCASADIYSKIKRESELNVGILTQCVKSVTVSKKMNPKTVENILLKVNSKLNGINHMIALDSVRPSIFGRKLMIIGADVTHPAPGTKSPSIAAVAASHDPECCFKYNLLFRLQPPKKEIIQDLEFIIAEQLSFFYRKNKFYPEVLLYYRDGVSEGQFREILDVELNSIKVACSRIPNCVCKPKITFVVVQKRHHTRFFPYEKDGDQSKNNNVSPGTLIDTEITHPTEVDFYMVSHQSIQGTARPTKYHLLYNDNNISDEELERITYFLCHTFARCNRAVSYPAPTYYAHLGAFRARAYFEGQSIDMLDLESSQQKLAKIKDVIVNDYPMFFV